MLEGGVGTSVEEIKFTLQNIYNITLVVRINY
jgi:hypothetical protein